MINNFGDELAALALPFLLGFNVLDYYYVVG